MGGYFLILSFGLIFNACQKENFSTNVVSNQPEFVEGRLHFKSTKQLTNKVNELKKLNEVQLQTEMSKYYKMGFKPLRPFYGSSDFELIQEYAINKVNSFKSSDYGDIDDEDILIGDDFFAAFLNDNREIQVGDTIYKYTESGLYFSHIDDVEELYHYLEELEFKRNLKLIQPIDPCGLDPQEFGTQAMNAYVMRYIPVPDCGSSTGGGGNSGGSSTGGINGDTFISNLQECEYRHRDLKIFGILHGERLSL